MRMVTTPLLCLGILGTLFYCRNQPVSIDVSDVERQINYIKFKDFTLTLDLILGTGKDKNNKFKSPYSMAVDSAGNICIADTGNKRIQVFSSIGEYIETIGGKVREKIKLSSPRSLTFDDDDNLYVAEFTRTIRRIVIVSKEGKLIDSFRLPFFSGKIAVNKDFVYIGAGGSAYLAKYFVYKYSKKGEFITGFEKTSGKDRVNSNIRFSIDAKGNFFIAYTFLPKVKKYSPDGKLLMEFEYHPSIKNKQRPIEMTTRRGIVRGGKGSVTFIIKEYPVCYDIAVDISGMIYLLVAVDHSKDERCTLYRFDPSGNLLEKVDLPILCGKIHIDSFNNFYFLSPTATHLVFSYTPPDN